MKVGIESCIYEVEGRFEELVNESIKEGWKPTEGVSIASGIDVEYENYGAKKTVAFTQAMVKRF